MTILAAHLWPGLGLAGLIGLAAGLGPDPLGRAGRIGLALAVLALVLGGAASLSGEAAGRAALWLDSAVLHAAAAAAGLCLGRLVSLLRARFRPA